jgi:hypothetical protein
MIIARNLYNGEIRAFDSTEEAEEFVEYIEKGNYRTHPPRPAQRGWIIEDSEIE